MKTSATLLALFLTASALAQEAPKPDYSKDAIQEFVMAIDIESEDPGVRYYRDSVFFNFLGTTWNFNYLPGPKMRLSGTELGTGVTQLQPNPFALTNTVIATSPRAMRRGANREVSQELKRINRRLNATVKVKTD
jgi:hypothetical protein